MNAEDTRGETDDGINDKQTDEAPDLPELNTQRASVRIRKRPRLLDGCELLIYVFSL